MVWSGSRRREVVKVVLADDHQMMREGLRAVLERAGVEVVAEAADGHDAIAKVKRHHPDVLVIDIAMPLLNGVDATRRLSAELPGLKIIALSMNSDRRYVLAMLRAGATGYLLKNEASDDLLNALSLVAGGKTYLSPAVAGGVVEEAMDSHRPVEGPLSVREREVLQLIAEGKTSKEIGAVLHIAVPTVETHRRQITMKLNLRTIADLTKYAIREGMTRADS
jgi:DNA-binding NarL/FixJ family response regulator